MKVIGGSFGADGKAQAEENSITVNGHMIGRSKIKSMNAAQHRQREFSAAALFIGLFLFVPMLALPAGYLFGDTAGLLAGLAALIFTMLATFEHVESRIVTITTDDDKTASIQCKKKQADKLMSLAPH